MTPDEFRAACTSCLMPLAFADSCRDLSEEARKRLSKIAQEVYAAAIEEERANFRLPSHNGGIARLALLAAGPWSQAKRVNIGPRAFPATGPWRDAACQILAQRRPSWADDWVAAQLNVDGWEWQITLGWNDVRELMQSGVISKPNGDGYVRLLASRGFREFQPERDADVLTEDIWRLFEVESTAFDYVPEPKRIDLEKWRQGERATRPGRLHEVYDGWPRRLYELSHNGAIDRNRLLDAALNAFWRDFRLPMRSGLLRFLEILELSDDELDSRQHTLCELLRCEQGPVVGSVLKWLARLQKLGRLDVPQFLAAAPAAFTISSASQPKGALSLVDRSTKSAREHLPAALASIQAALNHSSADVQEMAVDLLEKWRAQDAKLELRDLLNQVTFVVPAQRRRLEELAQRPGQEMSVSSTDPAASPDLASSELEPRKTSVLQRLTAIPAPLRTALSLDDVDQALAQDILPPVFDPDPAVCPVLSGQEAIEPIQDVDELIEAVAHLYEVVDGADQIERIVDGLVRLGGNTTENFAAKTESLRHPDLRPNWSGQSVTILMWTLPGFFKLVGQWLGTTFQDPWSTRIGQTNSPAIETYNQRFEELRDRMQRGQYGPVLATPTHRGGWIDPRVFVTRLKQLHDQKLVPDRLDLVGGLLRLAPDFAQEALELAADLPNVYRSLVAYALGEEVTPTDADRDRAPCWLAAGRARYPRRDLEELDGLWLSNREPNGISVAKYRFSAGTDPQTIKAQRWTFPSRGSDCVTIVPDEVNPSKLSERPSVALAAYVTSNRYFNMLPDWQLESIAWLWPANPDATLARACQQLMQRLDDKGSAFEPVAGLLTSLRTPDRGWSEIGRVAIWLCLLSRDDVARGIGIDVLIDGIADGRAHAEPLGSTLLQIAAGEWVKLNRLTDSLREVSRTSLLAEWVVADILEQLVASWQSVPRDGHHVLSLQLDLLTKLGKPVTTRVREVLGKVSGSGKSARLVKQLCALQGDENSIARKQAAVEAAHGRLNRAERMAQFATVSAACG